MACARYDRTLTGASEVAVSSQLRCAGLVAATLVRATRNIAATCSCNTRRQQQRAYTTISTSRSFSPCEKRFESPIALCNGIATSGWVLCRLLYGVLQLSAITYAAQYFD